MLTKEVYGEWLFVAVSAYEYTMASNKFWKGEFFFSSVVSVLLPKINWSHSHGSILGISMMLHGCVCQVVHLYQL